MEQAESLQEVCRRTGDDPVRWIRVADQGDQAGRPAGWQRPCRATVASGSHRGSAAHWPQKAHRVVGGDGELYDAFDAAAAYRHVNGTHGALRYESL